MRFFGEVACWAGSASAFFGVCLLALAAMEPTLGAPLSLIIVGSAVAVSGFTVSKWAKH